MQYACSRGGYVYREGEGSTGPSRGEHRLTVYRAHASLCVQLTPDHFFIVD